MQQRYGESLIPDACELALAASRPVACLQPGGKYPRPEQSFRSRCVTAEGVRACRRIRV
jgi:hypothetical protein